jgi:hypothetical protein
MPRPKTTLKSEYADFFGDLSSYFAVYGGWPKIIYSPYTHAALFVTLLCWSKWHGANWTATPLAVLPALLGFTLAAYALFLGFGDESFRKFLANSANQNPVARKVHTKAFSWACGQYSYTLSWCRCSP